MKPGDLVRLKSGGSPMTVTEVGSSTGIPDGACVTWFQDWREHVRWFPAACLVEIVYAEPEVEN